MKDNAAELLKGLDKLKLRVDSDVAFAACEVRAESTVYQKILKTLAKMKIHTDLAGYH